MSTHETCETCKYFRELFILVHYGACEDNWMSDHYKHVLSEDHLACDGYEKRVKGEDKPWE